MLIKWDCSVKEGCERKVKVKRMDKEKTGISREKSYYYEVSDTKRRTNYEAVGILIYARVEGTTSYISLMNIVLNISSAIGLLFLSKYLIDFIMLNVLREKNHYRNMKLLKMERNESY